MTTKTYNTAYNDIQLLSLCDKHAKELKHYLGLDRGSADYCWCSECDGESNNCIECEACTEQIDVDDYKLDECDNCGKRSGFQNDCCAHCGHSH